MSRRSRTFKFDVAAGTLEIDGVSVATTADVSSGSGASVDYGSVTELASATLDYDTVNLKSDLFYDYGDVADANLSATVADTSVTIEKLSLEIEALRAKQEKTASFVAVAGGQYLLDTTSSAITVTLPSSPTVGAIVTVIDAVGNASINNITIDPNGGKIESGASNVTLGTNRVVKKYVYYNATQGWVSEI